MLPDATELEAFFFRAMLQGWASTGATKTTISTLPGSKMLPPYREGDLELVDVYLVNPDSDSSCGMTVISCCGTPVWSMSYRGWYYKEAVPFLKQCLHEAYERQKFVGGRGLPVSRQLRFSNFLYTNTCKGTFQEFSGVEWVYLFDPEAVFGTHSYEGGMFLPKQEEP